MLVKNYKSSLRYEAEQFDIQDVMEKVNQAQKSKYEISFCVLSKKVVIYTREKGNVFGISTFEDNKSYLKSKGVYCQVGEIEKFANLVANYSPEREADFILDKDFQIRNMIDGLPPEMKDQILYAFCLEKVNKNAYSTN